MNENAKKNLQIVMTVEARNKIAMLCGVFGLLVGGGTYILTRGITDKMVEGVNILLDECYEIKLKER